ncbi:MAG TPA: FHA domain-containing protein, partial [Kofleriaceae bacterium]|nr:FHA domain-containing protein [Kofleriaceae bacterium]
MPRAKPFPDSEEEEKTTIESQWEDEASTTVEQGDVADKIRSLVEPRREITSTGAGPVDEPTVDDQHAQMSAITPVRDVARLAITQGNDAGTEIEIRPGKAYTIGRAIDNDVVLTDIAVSRKHFDLRFEDAAWVIVDRGSGNGTVVNGNLEDNPFMLANGDVIEIGNTVFRFDQPNGASRPQPTVDLDADDEEMSTVAGKPMRGDRDVEPMPAPVAARPPRPKTLPPPTPLRPSGSTQPPPLGFPPPGPAPLAQPASTMPMAQMANRPPLGSPNLPGVAPMAPAMLGDQRGFPNLPNPSPLGSQQLPTTIPGQGAPPPRQQQMQMYPYPQATEIPPHSVHAQMLLIQTQNRRGDHSTAHVPPMSFDQLPQQRYSQPQLTKKAKVVLIGVGLAVFAAVMTVAIVKSNSGKPQASAATTGSNDNVKLESKTEAKVAAKTTPVEETPEPAKPEPAKTAVTTTPATTPAAPTAKAEPAKTSPPPPTAIAKTEPVKTPPPPPVKTEPVKTEPVKTEPVKVVKTEPKKTEAKKTEPKTTKRPEKRTEARRETQVAVATPPEPKKTGGNPDAARSEAERLYRAKKFSDASTYLANQAKKFDEDIAKDMRRTSEYYAKLGRAFAQGTAPATRAVDAFESLRSAQNYDRNLSNAFDAEIQTKLAQVAPKAALSYVAAKNYPAARSAMLFAKQFPSATES